MKVKMTINVKIIIKMKINKEQKWKIKVGMGI